jgi:hypothetical protein
MERCEWLDAMFFAGAIKFVAFLLWHIVVGLAHIFAK